jgi:hypothetical protein
VTFKSSIQSCNLHRGRYSKGYSLMLRMIWMIIKSTRNNAHEWAFWGAFRQGKDHFRGALLAYRGKFKNSSSDIIVYFIERGMTTLFPCREISDIWPILENWLSFSNHMGIYFLLVHIFDMIDFSWFINQKSLDWHIFETKITGWRSRGGKNRSA